MKAVCATPPHLEGAPLFQIPLESLNCDGNVNKYDNADVLRQLEVLSKESNLTFAKEFSDAVSTGIFYMAGISSFLQEHSIISQITLKNIHWSADYGLILTWSVNLNGRDFACDAVFIYHESELGATLVENAPIKVCAWINSEKVEFKLTKLLIRSGSLRKFQSEQRKHRQCDTSRYGKNHRRR